MGIFPAIVDLLRAEQAHRPIEGDLLLIGRQLVEVPGRKTWTDVELFADVCPGARVRALDVSDYEGAEVVHDLCRPIPAGLAGIADFIYDGSCLDNIWDAGQAVRNLSAMLRPRGRIFLFEHGTAIQGALQVYSPEWFFDFFAANDYADCQVTLGSFATICKHVPWTLTSWDPFDADGRPVTATPGTTLGDFVNLVLAEKGERSTDDRTPIQGQYRELHGVEVEKYRGAHRRYAASERRRKR